jgi:uncharacterized protein DUF302
VSGVIVNVIGELVRRCHLQGCENGPGWIDHISEHPLFRRDYNRVEGWHERKKLDDFRGNRSRSGAAEANMPLRPTTLVVFGSPRGGTPLMQVDQRVGIDLPLKVLIWENVEGKVWLT